MVINNKFADMKERERVGGRQSKTVRKFTGYFGQDALPDCVSVSLDWLSFMVCCFLPEPATGDGVATSWLLNDVVGIMYLQKGTPMFCHSYQLFYFGEPVAYLHTHSRNKTIIKEGLAKLEIMNQVLYSTSWSEVLDEVMKATQCTRINNVSGLHIAIDNVNHIKDFLNLYVRQGREHKSKELKTLGKWDKSQRVKMKGKARLDCKVFDRKTGQFQNFKIGNGHKYITVYDKTSELKKSHKEYIWDAWKQSGVVGDKDHAKWGARTKEMVTAGEQEQQVFRCELRMSSQAIKQIKNFDLKRLSNPQYLLSLFKTQIENFFQFVVIENDTNISRARIVDLFQFELMRVPLLAKIPRAVVQGAYKAKMAIHNAYMGLMKGLYRGDEAANAAVIHIKENLQIYNLDRWFLEKEPEWINLYGGLIPLRN